METNSSGTTGLGRNALAPGGECGVREVDGRHRQHRRGATAREPAAELEPATRDHEIDDRQFWPTIGEQLLGERWVECDADVVALGPQEVLEQLGRVAIAFGEQDDDRDPVRIGTTQTARPVQSSGEQPVGVGCGGTALQLVDEEAQLFQLVPGVDALATFTAGRDHDAVALLPGPQCRGFDTEHAGDRADRIDRPVAQPTVIVELRSSSRNPRLDRQHRVETRELQEPDHTARRIDDQQLRVSSPTLSVQFHEQPEAGRIDEAQTRAIELDITVHAVETRSHTRHLGRIEFAEQSQPAVTVASDQEPHQVDREAVQQQPRKTST